MNKWKFILAFVFLGLLAVESALLLQLNKNTDRKTESPVQSQKSFVLADTCQPPGVPQNVKITYPYCDGGNCSFTQASCTWSQASSAASYNVKVTEVDSNTVIRNDSVNSSTLQVILAVTSGKTYKCEIAAVSSCGAASASGIDSLLCQISGVFSTPTPTSVSIAPSAAVPSPTVPSPTAAGVVLSPTPIITTSTPSPTMTPGGSAIFLFGLGGTVLTVGGFILLLAL